MLIDLLIGIALSTVGIVCILFRKRIARIIHAGLERFYGEATADMLSDTHSSPIRYAIVGCMMIALGLFKTIAYLSG